VLTRERAGLNTARGVRFCGHGGPRTTTNCLLLCRACHQDVHAHTLLIRGEDANAADGVAFERCQW
jgi:hypothetical protein